MPRFNLVVKKIKFLQEVLSVSKCFKSILLTLGLKNLTYGMFVKFVSVSILLINWARLSSTER